MKVCVWILKRPPKTVFVRLQLIAPRMRLKHECSLAAQKNNLLEPTCWGCAQGGSSEVDRNCGR